MISCWSSGFLLASLLTFLYRLALYWGAHQAVKPKGARVKRLVQSCAFENAPYLSMRFTRCYGGSKRLPNSGYPHICAKVAGVSPSSVALDLLAPAAIRTSTTSEWP